MNSKKMPLWLTQWRDANEIRLWGGADLRDLQTPQDETGQGFPYAVSFVVQMDPVIMAGIQRGPNQAYAAEYAQVNQRIDDLSRSLALAIKKNGFRSIALAASVRSDPVKIQGDFPHKTAATRAGLGWIGRNCQLISRPFGPWIRLGTVFTDYPLACSKPLIKSFCGRCTRCVDACPANALTGHRWYPGLERSSILDVLACDQWKKDHYFQFHKGHTCGICSAVCPYGMRILKKVTESESIGHEL